jgi:hypothetical protein
MANGAGNVLVGHLLNGKKTPIEVLIGCRNQIDSTERASLVAECCGVKFAAKNDRWTFASVSKAGAGGGVGQARRTELIL